MVDAKVLKKRTNRIAKVMRRMRRMRVRAGRSSYRSLALKAINNTRNSLTKNQKNNLEEIVLNKKTFNRINFERIQSNVSIIKKDKLQNEAMRIINRFNIGNEKKNELTRRVRNANTFNERNHAQILFEVLKHREHLIRQGSNRAL